MFIILKMSLHVYLEFYDEFNNVVAFKLNYLFKLGLLQYVTKSKISGTVLQTGKIQFG